MAMTSAQAVAAARNLLLASPARINVRAAALRLISARTGVSEQAATWRLDELATVDQLNDLFAEVMPKEYRRLKKATRVQRADKFFSLLGFPVNEDYMREEIWQGRHDGYSITETMIPVISMQRYSWESGEDFSALPPVYQLATILDAHYGEGEDGQTSPDWPKLQRACELPDSLRPEGSVDYRTFERTFECHRSPLKYLPLAIKVTNFNTGCFWYDFSYEWMENDLQWTSDNVGWLRATYREGLVIEAKVDLLNDWLGVNSPVRMAQALRLYRKALKVSNGKKRKKRDDSAPEGRALVRIL